MRILYNFLILMIINLNLVYSQNKLDYQKRGKPPNRMEGIKPKNIGGLDLELISFTSYLEPPQKVSDINYRIKFYLTNDSHVFINAQELQPVYYYWMELLKNDWLKGWQESSAWTTNEVLVPLKLGLGEIGILGRINDFRSESGDIVPLIIYHSSLPQYINSYALYFRAGKNFNRIHFYIYRLADSTLVGCKDLSKKFFAGETFKINFELNNENKGFFALGVIAEYEYKRGKLKRIYRFYHNPIIN